MDGGPGRVLAGRDAGLVAGAVLGAAERGQCGFLAGQRGGRGRSGPGRRGGGQQFRQFAGPGAVLGADRLTAQQPLRGVPVEPAVPLVGHHMSFCVRAAVSVTPGTYDSAAPSRHPRPCAGTPPTHPPVSNNPQTLTPRI
ncbi:hypothetical protein [Streptomyces celluloflavus]